MRRYRHAARVKFNEYTLWLGSLTAVYVLGWWAHWIVVSVQLCTVQAGSVVKSVDLSLSHLKFTLEQRSHHRDLICHSLKQKLLSRNSIVIGKVKDCITAVVVTSSSP